MAATVSRIFFRPLRHALSSINNLRNALVVPQKRLYFTGMLYLPSKCLKKSLSDRNIFYLNASLRNSPGVCTSCKRLSDKNENLDYTDIPHLLKETLESAANNEEVFETQMDVLDKLVQYKLGRVAIDAVRSSIANLSHQQIYELAASIFRLTDKVGSAASEMAAPLFWMATMAGSTDAKYSYAKLLQLGEGVNHDPIEAGKMFKELSEQGHPFAQFSLAQMYYSGVGIEQDLKLAHELFEVSAKNGILPAYTFLGNMYRTGQGVNEDKAKAIEMYMEGERKGDLACNMALAYCYGHGDGVSENQEKSFRYHEIAAQKGHPAAQYNLGVHYFAGKGVVLDMSKAAEWFQFAAEQGFEFAQVNLGNMYYNGLGVDKDLHKAREWYQKAAEKIPNAKALLEEVESELKDKPS